MIINAIRYQTHSNDKETYLRFTRPSPKLRHIGLVSGSKDELLGFMQAFSFCLTGDHQDRLLSASLNLIDGDGNSWVIDRNQGQVRVFCNREVVPEGLTQGQLATAFDLDVDFQRVHIDQVLRSYELKDQAGALVAEPIRWERGPAREPLQDIYLATRAQMEGLFPKLGALEDVKILAVLDQLEPLYRNYEALFAQSELLKKQLWEDAKKMTQSLDDVRAQIELGEKIKAKAARILDPGYSPKVLWEQYYQIEEELADTLADKSLIDSEANPESVPFEKCLNLLARLKIYESLVRASKMALQKSETDLTPTLKAYYQTIEAFLQNDTEITKELQSCLTILTEAMTPIKKKAPLSVLAPFKTYWSKHWSDRWQKLKVKLPLLSPPEAPEWDEGHSLGKIRLAIDYALGRLGELHANLKKAPDTVSEAFSGMMERHERLTAEYSRLNYSWQELARQHKIPLQCQIKDLMQLIALYGEITSLKAKRESLKNEIHAYKASLSELKQLVEAWRQLTGSSKQADLDNPTLLLQEIRAILDHASHKKHQASKLRELQIKLQADEKLDQTFKHRLTLLQSEWQAVLGTAELTPLAITSGIWPQLFQSRAVLREIKSHSPKKPGVKSEEILFQDDLDSPPIQAYFLFEALPRHQENLLKLLKNSSQSAYILLLGSKEFEASLALPIAKAQKVDRTPPPPKQKESPVLSAKARQALMVFQTSK